MVYECVSGVYMIYPLFLFVQKSLQRFLSFFLILVVCNFVSLHEHGEIYYFLCFKIMNK